MRILTALALSMSMATTTVRAGEATLVADDEGEAFKTYVAGPADAEAAILILHDWFGVTDFTRQSVEQLGRKGLRVLAIDLYNDRSAATHEEATALSSALDPGRAQRRAHSIDCGLGGYLVLSRTSRAGGAPRSRRPVLESHVYPGADHAFAQPLYNAGESYDAAATEALLDLFLARHLKVDLAGG